LNIRRLLDVLCWHKRDAQTGGFVSLVSFYPMSSTSELDVQQQTKNKTIRESLTAFFLSSTDSGARYDATDAFPQREIHGVS